MFNTTPDYILYEISYENLILYGCAAPRHDDVKEEWDDSLDANNPDNFRNNKDEEEIYIR